MRQLNKSKPTKSRECALHPKEVRQDDGIKCLQWQKMFEILGLWAFCAQKMGEHEARSAKADRAFSFPNEGVMAKKKMKQGGKGGSKKKDNC